MALVDKARGVVAKPHPEQTQEDRSQDIGDCAHSISLSH